jgi:hypothetical protein
MHPMPTQIPFAYVTEKDLPRPRRRVRELPVEERPLYPRTAGRGTAALSASPCWRRRAGNQRTAGPGAGYGRGAWPGRRPVGPF